LTSVLLPLPFSPTSACTSPARKCSEQSRSALVGPKAFASADTVMSGCVAPPTDIALAAAAGLSSIPESSSRLSSPDLLPMA
jgi:hypothetical protein